MEGEGGEGGVGRVGKRVGGLGDGGIEGVGTVNVIWGFWGLFMFRFWSEGIVLWEIMFELTRGGGYIDISEGLELIV